MVSLVCPSVHLWTKTVSALYLQQYLRDPFHTYTSYQATSEGVSHVIFVFKIQKLQIWASCFDLGSNMNQ